MSDDEALWIQLTRRSAAAFEEIYRANFARVRRFLGFYLGNRGAVDDVGLGGGGSGRSKYQGAAGRTWVIAKIPGAVAAYVFKARDQYQ